jgi:hypothetical protein
MFGYHSAMNTTCSEIGKEITAFLQLTGMSAYRLSQLSGVNINVIQRVRKGKRQDVRCKTADKLRAVFASPPPPESGDG